ncbi:MAG: sugar ABC transporter ATP-binding protein [Microbacterium sp.]|uniref:Galactose/methyl galactoside import ATP-binding protein MglA n=2 Tax=Bacteria TaxID=2 RepID=A0A0F0LVL5_9MICO|nr:MULTISPECIES: ATP-binding cassette domain-containing protein [Microbacterium]MAL05999.1 sugar ABC transporter ATP-binding protein [Microbacterium sp.]KJL36719.1 Galactose/methyl galactoside import ATP-binding protein MglA [Microbacterium ginsengisoli]MBN9207434.1 sugar ABC transporter ATP-binding protein [Microbacterium ginsengisoli]ODU76592.1 MAG: ABC transporter ATP-binding protein [Microbacterium sp. SCN 71-21]HAN23203.1 sugar ABC transporter ATP-binding protein [Microbacterium ginsengis
MNDIKVELRDIRKTFGSVEALKGASLTARRGEVTAIVGDNGAGKSTLVKCLTGLITPDSGTITIDGKDVRFSSPKHARAAGIETVYQDLALSDQLSIWQNLYMDRELTAGIGPLRFLRRGEMKREAHRLVADLAVNVPSVTRAVKRLSGGQRQAVAIARGVMWARGLIILDEPTAALGLRETAQVEGLIRRVVDAGETVLVVSHNFEQVKRLSSQVWVMRAGNVVQGVRTEDVSGEELVGLVTGAITAV